MSSRPAAPAEVTVYAAECASELNGQVEFWEPPLTDEQAIARLREGFDVVVRGGPDARARKNRARALAEAAFGVPVVEDSRAHKGRRNTWTRSLPHYNPADRDRKVHAFYENDKRWAKERK